MNEFYQLVLKNVKPGMTVLDLGCGDLHLASKMANQGAFVTAVDIKQPDYNRDDNRIAFYQTSIEEFCQRAWPYYDLVVMSNSLQFVDKEFAKQYLFPKVGKSQFLVATLARDCEPPLKGLQSTWGADEGFDFEDLHENVIQRPALEERGYKWYPVWFIS